jgi:hypothetical protein
MLSAGCSAEQFHCAATCWLPFLGNHGAQVVYPQSIAKFLHNIPVRKHDFRCTLVL